jgi:Protein of unknown function, DUF481
MTVRLVSFLCIMFWSLPLLAREKTDVLIMSNGDHLTCQIKGLSAGVLYVSLDYILGTSSLQWSKVSRIQSHQLFIVKTQDGSVRTGTLDTPETGPGRPIELRVEETPEKAETVAVSQVVGIGSTSDKFWERFNGSLSSGIIFSKANTNTQFNFGAQTQYVRERWSAGGSLNSTLSDSSGTTVSTRNDGTLSGQRLLRWNNYFAGVLADFLQSSEQGISLQSSVGGGAGRYFKNTNRAQIQVLGGAAWQQAHYQQSGSQDTSQNTAAFLVAAKTQFFRFNKTNFTATATVFPALTQLGRVHLTTNVTYFVKVFGDLEWNASFYGNWDNEPPTGFVGSDYGTSSGLSWTFGSR